MFRIRLSFEQRLLLSFIALLVVSSAASILASSYSNSTYFTKTLAEKLSTGREVADVYLKNRSEQLATSVHVLVNDWGFKSAVATQDIDTINSVLSNHAQRIGADLAIMSDLAGVTLSSTGGADARFRVDPSQDFSVARLQYISGKLYQTLTLPVEVPDAIGWITMAFVIDSKLAAELSQITNLNVSFVRMEEQQSHTAPRMSGNTNISISSELLDYKQQLARDDQYLSDLSELVKGEGDNYLLLRASTSLFDQAKYMLLNDLLSILGLALCVCIVVSMWFARKISNPVGSLVQAAKRIRKGDYQQAVEVHTGGELALLGKAMNEMMEGIASREGEILRQAYTESITGLHNKNKFVAEFEGYAKSEFCLALITILDFKDIGFSYGESVGRTFKCAVRDRLQDLLQDSELPIFAFSSLEFAVLLPAFEVKRAQIYVGELVDALSETYVIDEWQIESGFSGAVVAYPEDIRDEAQLLHRLQGTADRASSLRANCLGYLADEEETRRRQLDIIASFDVALNEGQFHLCFQPKVAVDEGYVHEAEVLLRWVHPKLGFIPPDEFILLAERSGNIRKITSWVLEKTVEQAVTWANQGVAIKLAINISPHDLVSFALPTQIQNLFDEYGAKGEMFTIEVTESAVLEDEVRAIEALIRLKRMGITLSVDDYGTGFSSLAQIKKLPVDELKIDKAFVLELDKSPEDLQIVRSTIDLGHNLGMRVVAEGVENLKSFELLRDLKCDKAQGYYFSKPLKAVEFVAWCTTFNSTKGNNLRSLHG